MVSNESDNQCIFCNEKKAIYYCEGCNLSFCEDCGYSNKRAIYVCGHCKSKNIECRQRNSVNGELYICKDCGSLDIEGKLVVQRKCPSCHSPYVISVAKKKLILIKQLKDVINGFKLGYQELKTFLEEYREIKRRTVALRAVGYLHDPVIEQTLLAVYETIRGISKEILERAIQEINLFRLQMKKYSDYSDWTPASYPQIDLFLKQIQENVVQYQKYVRNMLAQPKKEKSLVQSKLNVIRYYKSIYDEYSEQLNLFPRELPVCAFCDIKFSKSTIHSLKNGKGILFLTDQRLIFIRKSGILRKKIKRIFNFNYNQIINVAITGRIFKKLDFVLNQGNLAFTASRRMMKAILDYLRISVNFGKYRINNGEVLNKLDQLQISTNNLEKQIDKKIVQLMAGIPCEAKGEPWLKSYFNTEINQSLGRNHEFVDTNRMIFKLRQEKFSINQTIQNLEQKFRVGMIKAEIYVGQFRHLQGELFMIDNKLDALKNQLKAVANRF